MAGEEDVVRNDYIEDFATLAKNEQGEIHTVPLADHTTIVLDGAYGSQVIRKSLAFLDKIISTNS